MTATKQKVVFLDRDGVLDVDKGYLYKTEDLQWIPGAKSAVALLCDLGYKVLVATNQSGIARGYYSLADMENLHRFMEQEFEHTGGRISHFYYCPHYKDGCVTPYAVECQCRKPKPGMILQGLADFKADTRRSFMIGDNAKDVQAAEAAGIRGFLFPGGNLLSFVWKILDECAENSK